MGKASRKKRQGDIPSESDRRSAFALMWRENNWVIKNPASEQNLLTAKAVLAILPHARVVAFSADQAAAIADLDKAEIRDWAADSHAPFKFTLFDFGGVDVGGGWNLWGALWDEAGRTIVCQFCVEGTDDWRTAILMLDNIARAEGDLKRSATYTANGTTAAVSADVYEAAPSMDRTAEILTGASMVLESTNVDLAPAGGPLKGHRAHGVPHYEVIVRQPSRRAASGPSKSQEWSHRWEVRGHFKHFRQGAIFDSNPDRRVQNANGECVRVWCPPYVKGPEDKPLIPKRRVIA